MMKGNVYVRFSNLCVFTFIYLVLFYLYAVCDSHFVVLSITDVSHAIRREFLREILYNNIAIIAIQHSKIYFVDTFGDFSHTVE